MIDTLGVFDVSRETEGGAAFPFPRNSAQSGFVKKGGGAAIKLDVARKRKNRGSRNRRNVDGTGNEKQERRGKEKRENREESVGTAREHERSLKTIGSYFNRFPSCRGELKLFLPSFYAVGEEKKKRRGKRKKGRKTNDVPGWGFYKIKAPRRSGGS